MRLRQRTGPVGAGARDRRVTLQARPDNGTGDSGFPTDGPWTDLAVVMMARDELEAVEIERGAQTLAISTTRWEFPYRADCDPELVDVPKLRRLLFYGRVYDIVSAAPIGRHVAIEVITQAHSQTPTETP